jgi:sulfite reductase (NADPH) flavoprotein alpha-component
MSRLFSRAVIGNLLVALLLALIAWLLLRLHLGESWWAAPPRANRWQWAAASTLAYAIACLALWWRSRPAREPASAEGVRPVVVAWASQTGFAQELAERSAGALRAAEIPVRLRSLDKVDATLLAQTDQLLLIASTTGEGDPPDHVAAFLRNVMTQPIALPRLRYGVLALGDRSYEHFCGFGHQLDTWLRQQGATPLFDTVEVDNADTASLRHWQQLLGQLGGDTSAAGDWSVPDYQSWKLLQRQCTNPGSAGHPVFHLSLKPAQDELPSWQAGDIAEVGPCNSAAAVQSWLATHQLDGEQLLDGQPLREHLSRRQLVDVPPRREPSALLAALKPLPHREYSVASIPADGNVQLLLRRQLRPDGTPGIGSGWLCDFTQPGDLIDLRLRNNQNFHPPATDVPLILIGNGTGIAGLRAQLRARIAAGHHRNWLLFGERNAAHDFHFGDELQRWHQQGQIQRLDAVFSRDGGEHRYVQDALAAASDTLREWIADGATILVCGSLQGMAPAVDAVIEQALGREQRDALVAAGHYRRDVY